MNPENGPTPEEMGVAPAPPPVTPEIPPTGPNPPAQPPQPRYPQRQPWYMRGLVGRAFRRGRNPELAADAAEVNQEDLRYQREAEDMNWANRRMNPEGIQNPNTPDELVGMMEQMTVAQWRERKLQEVYGDGGIAWIRSFLDGERNFTMDESGEIQRNAYMELAQKAIVTVFNRRTLLSAGTATIVGALTGGTLLPAAGAIFGSILGRGSIEAWHSINGGERKIRERIARAQFAEMGALRDTARQASEPDIEDNERNQHVANLVDGFYHVSDDVESMRGEIVTNRKLWNTRRRAGELIGGIAGMGLNMAYNINHLKDVAMNMDINHDHIYHAVEKINGAWHYVFNSAAESSAAQASHLQIATDALGRSAHALGKGGLDVAWGAIRNMIPDAMSMAAFWSGMYLGRVSETGTEDNMGPDNQQRAAAQNQTNSIEGGKMREQAPAVGDAAGQWLERFTNERKTVPRQNEVWLMTGRWNPNPDAGYQMVYRIENVNYQTGAVTARILNTDLNPVEGDAGVAQLTLEDMLRNGGRREEVSARWMGQFGANDRLNIGATNNYLVDQNNRQLEPGDYRVVKDPNDDTKAILRQAGAADRHVSPFMMAMFGLNRYEPPAPPARPEGAPRAPLPAVSVRYEVVNRDQLPEALRLRLPNSFTITEVDRDNNVIDINSTEAGNAPDSITFDEWQQISQFLNRRGRQGRAPGGGGAQGGARRRP